MPPATVNEEEINKNPPEVAMVSEAVSAGKGEWCHVSFLSVFSGVLSQGGATKRGRGDLQKGPGQTVLLSRFPGRTSQSARLTQLL